MTAPPMSYFGGKTLLADRIVALLPTHQHYVEPFAGGLAVLLAKSPSRMETVNDLDGQLMTFWRVLRERPDDLIRACALSPHSRAEHCAAFDPDPGQLGELETARVTWLKISQGRSGTLRKTGWRHFVDPRGSSKSMPGYLDAYIDRMAAAAERLHRVSLECLPALEIIAKYGAIPEVCLYVDPPYLGSTRTTSGYRVDMRDDASHAELLDTLLQARASVVLSGYASDLYDTALRTWYRVEIPTITGQGGTKQARTEVVWCNRPICTPTLFDETPP
ncbi:DNA adenine methylase [Mycobacterium nebraskense]|nr:DNA adenine methylase [Mycobacterium nebraskense]